MTLTIRFRCSWYALFYSFVFRERMGWRGDFSHSSCKHTPKQLAILVWNLNHSLEIFCYTQVGNLKYCLVFFNFLLLFLLTFSSILFIILLKKYVLLEIKSIMIHECYFWNLHRGHNILKHVSFPKIETESDYY